jgi:tricarboxylate carrier
MTRIDIESPRFDQSTFIGRARHFATVTNPLNLLATEQQLNDVKYIVEAYRSGKSLEDLGITENELWAAKQLYDSAFHCQTGEKLFILGRMSCQAPANMIISGCMMTFYKTTPQVVLWQTVNQSFNAIVNYSNRNASVPVTTPQLATASAAATAAGVLTALGFNKVIQASPALASGIVGRFVPLLAVAAANCVNIPLMRMQVLQPAICCCHAYPFTVATSFCIV